jgi:hypothetical protein
MTFDPFAWLLLPLIPALVALYFLKLKRRDIVVSSTFLWARSVEDLHVNALFQKLRRNLLLLLQLLVLVALILAASKPVTSGSTVVGVTRLLLMDHSASMNVEEEGGRRLDLGRAKALDLIESAAAEDRMAVIAFADRPRLLHSLTGDQTKLRAAVRDITPTSLSTSFTAALQTAASLAETAPGAEIYVISDGCFENLSGVSSELERLNIRFVPVGAQSDNVGITELDVRRTFSRDSRVEVFVAVGNGSDEPRETTLGLYVEDRLVDAIDLALEPGQVTAHVFDGTNFPGETVRVAIDRGGSLPDDDQAWTRIDAPVPVRVLLVGDRNIYLENVLSVDALVDLRRVDLLTFEALRADGRLASDPAEVLIFDGACPATPANLPTLYIGCRPDIPDLQVATSNDDQSPTPGADGVATEQVGSPLRVVDWDRGHPVNRWNRFADLLIANSDPLPPGGRFRSLIDGVHGSLAGTLPWSTDDRPFVDFIVLGFEIEDTNWPWLAGSFSPFFTNAIAWLGSSAGHTIEPSFRTGDALVYRPRETGTSGLQFRGPDGTLHDVVERSGEAVFTGTDMPGIYDLLRDNDVIERFPVALLSESELGIKPRTELKLGANRVATPQEIPASRDWWKWFAILALGAVLVEWWVYNRRMAI